MYFACPFEGTFEITSVIQFFLSAVILSVVFFPWDTKFTRLTWSCGFSQLQGNAWLFNGVTESCLCTSSPLAQNVLLFLFRGTAIYKGCFRTCHGVEDKIRMGKYQVTRETHEICSSDDIVCCFACCKNANHCKMKLQI